MRCGEESFSELSDKDSETLLEIGVSTSLHVLADGVDVTPEILTNTSTGPRSQRISIYTLGILHFVVGYLRQWDSVLKTYDKYAFDTDLTR